MVENDQAEADEISNRHVNFLMIITIVFAVEIAMNVIVLLFQMLKLFI